METDLDSGGKGVAWRVRWFTVHRNSESTGIRDPQGSAKANKVTPDLDNVGIDL